MKEYKVYGTDSNGKRFIYSLENGHLWKNNGEFVKRHPEVLAKSHFTWAQIIELNNSFEGCEVVEVGTYALKQSEIMFDCRANA